MARYGRNAQLREYHRLFTTKRDHKVGEAQFKGSGNLGHWYECPICHEMVDRSGSGWRHQPRRNDEPSRNR
jgi:hypothetical protein